MVKKIWFITGTSRGFGRQWTEAALKRGDSVAATARDPEQLQPLVETYGDAILPLQLDVTHRTSVYEAVRRAHAAFGRLDIVVNNAGYGLFGACEESTEEQVRAQMETNFFGALWVTQAVLPYLREQRSGHIVQVSSIAGICAFPGHSIYTASKWALEGLSDSLAQEIADFGISVTLVEPGSFATDWKGNSSVWTDTLPVYAPLHEKLQQRAGGMIPGQPEATAKAILTLVDSPRPPLRLLLGANPFNMVSSTYEQRLKVWEEWNDVSRSAQS